MTLLDLPTNVTVSGQRPIPTDLLIVFIWWWLETVAVQHFAGDII